MLAKNVEVEVVGPPIAIGKSMGGCSLAMIEGAFTAFETIAVFDGISWIAHKFISAAWAVRQEARTLWAIRK